MSWENFRSRQESVLAGILLRLIRGDLVSPDGQGFVTIMNAEHKKRHPQKELHDWEARLVSVLRKAALWLPLFFPCGSRVNTVEQHAQDHSAVLSSYMDDRSFFTRNWDKVRARIEAWKHWSVTMGMPELRRKCQTGASSDALLPLPRKHSRKKEEDLCP